MHPNYFKKEALFDTCNHEVYGFGIYGSFTKEPGPDVVFIPDPDKMKQKKGRRKTTRLRNDMDEAETGCCMKWCSKCNGTGHTYKKCTAGVPNVNPAEAGPFGSGADGRRPRGRRSSTSSAP